MDFGEEGFLIWVFAFKMMSVGVFFRVFNNLTQLLNFFLLGVKFFVESNHVFGQFGNFGDLLTNHVQLPFAFLLFKLNHANFLFFLSNFLLAILEDVLLNVAFLVQNAQFIISVNQLDTHVVTTFAGVFVVGNEIIHFVLQRVDNQVQLVSVVDLLLNHRQFLSKLQIAPI